MASLEKLLVISSEDKDNKQDSNSDFNVALKESYYTQNVLRILVKEITIPNVFPNIRGSSYGSSQNNILNFLNFNVAQPQSVILVEGQYLIGSVNPLLDFVSSLENVINAVSTSTLSIVYNDLTNKLIFNVISGQTTTLLASSPMASVLGITNDLVLQPLTPTSAQAQVDLSGIQNVYVHSKEIADTHGIDADSGLISLVECVNLSNAPYGSYAYKKNDDDELSSIVYEDIRNLSRLRIVLRDNLGNKLPIGTHKLNVVLKLYLASG